MVQAGAIFPHGRGDGHAKGAEHQSYEIRQAGGGWNAVWIQAGQGEGGQGNEERGHGRALYEGGQHDGVQIDLSIEVGAHIADKRKDHEGESGDHARSEEHTSELQSLMRRAYAVISLKKKNK